jgi:hypothetical protein
MSANANSARSWHWRAAWRWPSLLLISAWLLACAGVAWTCRAAMQFDVFPGYDGTIPEASWFPVVCEIKNDGPSFKGTVEVEAGTYNQGQKRFLEVELPTGTLKRVVIPVFASTRGYSTWDVRLRDERGKTRAEQLGIQARKLLAPSTPLIGALSRTPAGAPTLKELPTPNSELQPTCARLQTSIFPDNPLVLEGLDCLYLNSERASDLTVNQVNAIFAWLNAGGHLIIGIEQPSDVTSSPWLKGLVPCDVKDLRAVAQHPELQEWLRLTPSITNAAPELDPQSLAQRNMDAATRRRYGVAPRMPFPGSTPPAATSLFDNLTMDAAFEAAELQVAVGPQREGTVEVTAGDLPLIVTTHRGRGLVTTLLFSPEREPVRSWKNLPVFWSKLAGVSGALYGSRNLNPQGGWSSDGIFGAMIDSRQVHKLPVGWLLLLLLVYLAVIGPLDQYWLKRLGKPMLTWITFPGYVVVFSLVIYLIGYKLRAGESEWNELHVVDVLSNGDRAELRGRTYSSVYSPSNQRYGLASQQKYATLRGEFAGLWGGGESGEKATIMQSGDSFRAEIFVPVWTSELFVSDWWNSANLPLTASVSPRGDGWQVHVENLTERKLTSLQVAIAGRMIPLGDLPAAQSLTKAVKRDDGIPLRTFVWNYGANFRDAVNYASARSARVKAGKSRTCPTPRWRRPSFLSSRKPRTTITVSSRRPGWTCPRRSSRAERWSSRGRLTIRPSKRCISSHRAAATGIRCGV